MLIQWRQFIREEISRCRVKRVVPLQSNPMLSLHFVCVLHIVLVWFQSILWALASTLKNKLCMSASMIFTSKLLTSLAFHNFIFKIISTQQFGLICICNLLLFSFHTMFSFDAIDHNNFLMSSTILFGSTVDEKRFTTLPFLSTKNFVKFHSTLAPVVWSFRYSYNGIAFSPFTSTYIKVLNEMSKICLIRLIKSRLYYFSKNGSRWCIPLFKMTKHFITISFWHLIQKLIAWKYQDAKLCGKKYDWNVSKTYHVNVSTTSTWRFKFLLPSKSLLIFVNWA